MAPTIHESEARSEAEEELHGDCPARFCIAQARGGPGRGVQGVPAAARGDLIPELTRAELAGEISEFHALVLRAIVGMIEERDADFVRSYLEMASVVATTTHEAAMVSDMQSTYDSLPMKSRAAAAYCLAWVEWLGR